MTAGNNDLYGLKCPDKKKLITINLAKKKKTEQAEIISNYFPTNVSRNRGESKTEVGVANK